MSDPYAAYQRLSFDRPHPGVLRVAMSGPADAVMHRELGRIWPDADRDASVRAIVLTGTPDAFTHGGDAAMIQQLLDDPDVRIRVMGEARDIVYNCINCTKPVVSAIRGEATGAGLACGLLADISIATPHAQIRDVHAPFGMAAGDHAVMIWPLLCGMAKAKYHLLLGAPVSGMEAERIGLVSLVVRDAVLEEKAVEVAATLAAGPPTAIRWTKYALNNWLRTAGPTFDVSLALEFMSFAGTEVREVMTALQAGRAPQFGRPHAASASPAEVEDIVP